MEGLHHPEDGEECEADGGLAVDVVHNFQVGDREEGAILLQLVEISVRVVV